MVWAVPSKITVLVLGVKVVTPQLPATFIVEAAEQVSVFTEQLPPVVKVPVEIVTEPVPVKDPDVPLIVRLLAPITNEPVPFTAMDVMLLVVAEKFSVIV